MIQPDGAPKTLITLASVDSQLAKEEPADMRAVRLKARAILAARPTVG